MAKGLPWFKAAFAFCAMAFPAASQEAFLSLPIACNLGETCFVEDYVDGDLSNGVYKDYACGLNSRDGHKGTDFALVDWASIDTGVDVLAAASGRIAAVRDTMVDDRTMPGVTAKNACGNAVLVTHDNGYRTLYCHLKRGSVRVSKGDFVAQGTPLGEVGLSGRTTHPHLHMTLYKGDDVVDPFHPEHHSQGCQRPDLSESLWLTPITYEKTLLRNAGFSLSVPSYEDLRAGTARINSAKPTDPLIVYAEAGFAQHGDVLTIRASGPSGHVFEHSRVMKSPKVSQLPAFGKKAPPEGWPTGEYLGQLTITRAGALIANRWAHVTVTP